MSAVDFSNRLRNLLNLDSVKEARHFNCGQLLPEHILIAILKEGHGSACRILASGGINLDEFRLSLANSLPVHYDAAIGETKMSDRTAALLNAAREEAAEFKADYTGTEHFLLAAFEENNSPAQIFLQEKNFNSDFLRMMIKAPSDRGTFPGSVYQPSIIRRENNSGGGNKITDIKIKPAEYPVLTPTLEEFAADLTAMAASGKLETVIGRHREINRLIRILSRKTKNNPVLVGEPGVGKTAIVEGLAQLLASGNGPPALSGRRIFTLDMVSIIAGTRYRGEFEERLKKILREIIQVKNIILFIDEIHTIIGAGGAEGSVDASNILKPGLSRGEIQCIGATTPAEYSKRFEKDASLERRFQPVYVEEPDFGETVSILEGIKKDFEDHHKVQYTPGAIKTAAKMAGRYISGRCMPDKAIDLLDEAGAMKKLEPSAEAPDTAGLENEINLLLNEKQAMTQAQVFERAAELRGRVRDLRKKLAVVRAAWEQNTGSIRPQVNDSDIRQVVAEITGIPLTSLEEQESRKLVNMENELRRGVIGQDDAVDRIAGAIRRSRVGISSPYRPVGSFVFLGPTGVGKTLLAKRLSEYLFQSSDSLVRIDMSDYMEKHNASRLVGAPPGYIGYEEGGVLTEKIRRNPYRVILFDEIEKAHRDVFNLLLQVLEEGELRDNLGHAVNFRNTVIIMTSNAGVREISGNTKLGFGNDGGLMDFREIESSAMSELKRFLSPEFINRLDEIVVFHPLELPQLRAILDIQLTELAARLAEQNYTLELAPQAKELLLEKGFDQKYGARPLRRVIQKELEDPLSVLMLEKPEGTVFCADARDGKIFLDEKIAMSNKIAMDEKIVLEVKQPEYALNTGLNVK